MRILVFSLLLLFNACAAKVTPDTILGFEHGGVNTDGYMICVDDSCSPIKVVREGDTLTFTIPSMTDGEHTITVVAFNEAGQAKSNAIRVRMN